MTWEEKLNKLYEALKSASTPIIYILIGIGANYTDHYRKGTLNFKQAVVSALMGIFVGYMSWKLCMSFGWENHAGYIIPVATMSGERLIPYLMQVAPVMFKKLFEKKTDTTLDE